LVCGVVAREARLGIEAITPNSRFASDLHINSLAVGRIVTRACRLFNAPTPVNLTEFADATPAMLAATLQELRDLPTQANSAAQIAGVRPWVATYALE